MTSNTMEGIQIIQNALIIILPIDVAAMFRSPTKAISINTEE